MKTPVPVQTPPATPPPSPLVGSGEVLHAGGHSHLTREEIAKAVARHKREHKEQKPIREK